MKIPLIFRKINIKREQNKMSDTSHTTGYVFWHFVRLVLTVAIISLPIFAVVFGIGKLF